MVEFRLLFYVQNLERFALINAGSIAGVYKKKKG
jgi:hypothetical protein